MSSSIGLIGHGAVPDSSARLRGFLTVRVDDDTLSDVVGTVTEAIEHVRDPSTTESRVSIRVIAPALLVDRLPHREAVVPLRDDLVIAYLGYNRPERSRGDVVRAGTLEARARASQRFSADGGPDLDGIATRFVRARGQGYTVEIIASPGDRRRVLADDRAPLAALLDLFGYRDDAVDAIVSEPGNTVALARHAGTVVGVVVAESAEVPLSSPDGVEIYTIVELTDSCVGRDHTGHALQALLHVALIERFVADDRVPDVIFSESTYGGSLANAAMLGRTFAGMLPDHVTIGGGAPGDTERSGYESLEVTYATPDQARRLVDRLRAAAAI